MTKSQFAMCGASMEGFLKTKDWRLNDLVLDFELG